MEDGVVTGNVYPKYTTQNPVARYLVNGYLQAVDGVIAKVNPSSIHEVGCGEGFVISRYCSEERRLLGTDFSKQMIASVQENRAGLCEGLAFEVADIYEMTPERHAAELILASEVLEHLENPEMALEKIRELASPYVIVSVPAEPVWRVLNMLRGKYWSALGNTPGHLQHWSKASFIAMVQRYFEVIEVYTPLPWTIVFGRVK